MARQFRFQPLQQALASGGGGMLARPESAYQPPAGVTTPVATPVEVEDRGLTAEEQTSVDEGWNTYKDENLGNVVIGGTGISGTGSGNRQYYLPTEAFPNIVEALGEQGMTSAAHILKESPDTPEINALKDYQNTSRFSQDLYDPDAGHETVYTQMDRLDPEDVQNTLDTYHNYLSTDAASSDLLNTGGQSYVERYLDPLRDIGTMPTTYEEVMANPEMYKQPLAKVKGTLLDIKDFYNKEQAIVDKWGVGTMYSPRKSDEVKDALREAFRKPAAEIEKSYRDQAKQTILSGLKLNAGNPTTSMRDTLGGILSGR